MHQTSIGSKRQFSPWTNHRLWLIFATLSLAVLMIGAIALRIVKTNAERQVKDRLEQILEATSGVLSHSLDRMISELSSFHYNMSLQTQLAQILSEAPALRSNDPRLTAFAKGIDPLIRTDNSLGFMITDKNQKILLNHFDGSDKLSVDLESLAFTSHPNPRSNAEAIELSQPFFLADKIRGGESTLVLAVRTLLPHSSELKLRLWLLYDAERMFEGALRPGRSWNTGEILAFDSQGTLFTDSRFLDTLYRIGLLETGQVANLKIRLIDPQANLPAGEKSPLPREQLGLTRMARAAISGQDGSDVTGYRDYRGVLVVGSWRWLRRFNFGLSYKVDEKEAFLQMHILNGIFLGLVGLLLVAIIISGIMSWRMYHAQAESLQSLKHLNELQLQMAHVSRIATMSEMATGLAHEINQPLLVISNYARALINDFERSSEIDPIKAQLHLHKIESGVLRAADIIHRIRRFVSNEPKQSGPIDLKQTIHDSLDLLQERKIPIEVETADHLPPIHFDEIQLQQIILNLLRNSLEAMRKVVDRSHRLQISAGVDPSDAGHVRLCIKDSGPGLDPQVKARLFEQFNSSNRHGMGLGLAISRTLMEKNGGKISLGEDSQDGVSFILSLPIEPASLGAEPLA